MTLPAFATERASYRSISAARVARSAANQPHAAAAAVDRWDSRPLHRRCCACNASSVGNVAAMQGGSHELNKAQAIPSSPVSPLSAARRSGGALTLPQRACLGGARPPNALEFWALNASSDNIFGCFM